MADDRAAKLRRRVYDTVAVRKVQERYGVELDGRALKTPERRDFYIPSRALAETVAAEWDAQQEHIDPHTMPMMQIACTCLDRVEPHRKDIEATIAKYGETDLFCYRAEGPADLVARQHEVWHPLLDWLSQEHKIVLTVTKGILPVQQSEKAISRLREVIADFDNHELAGLALLTQTMGSVVLGLAVTNGRLVPEEAALASQLDEVYQAELWGHDREAELRLRQLRKDVEDAHRYLILHRSGI